MTEYRHKMRMHAEPEAIFAFVADLRNLPKYLPIAEHVRASEDGGDKVQVEGRLHDQRFGSQGFFRADPAKLRLDWGAEGDRYAGSLAINPLDEVSEVVIELRIEEPPLGALATPSRITSRAGSTRRPAVGAHDGGGDGGRATQISTVPGRGDGR